MDLRSPARSLGSVASLVAVLTLAGAAAAQDRSADPPHHAGFHTGTLLFPAPGVMIAALGAEYLPDVTNDLAGVDGEILRAPTLVLKLGLADQAMFQVSWPAYNRLRVHSQTEPPLLGRRLGRVSTDWGDLTVATLIRLHADQGRWPGTGIRFAAKLPNSNEKLAIGDNTTDVFATALLAKSFARRVSIFADAGLGILTKRTTLFAQDDVFTYGLMADWRVRERLHAVGEITGHAASHPGGPGTGSRSEMRAGLELGHHAFHWSAQAIHGLSGWDSRGVGVSLNVSTSFALLERAAGPR
jgi:hypothetical protein